MKLRNKNMSDTHEEEIKSQIEQTRNHIQQDVDEAAAVVTMLEESAGGKILLQKIEELRKSFLLPPEDCMLPITMKGADGTEMIIGRRLDVDKVLLLAGYREGLTKLEQYFDASRKLIAKVAKEKEQIEQK